MHHHQHWSKIWGLLVMLSLLMAACAAPGAPSGPSGGQAAAPVDLKSKDTTTYTTATFGDPETFDPALDYETAGATVIMNTYNSLIFFNKTDPNSFVPELATEVPSVENGGIAADGKSYTFKIRQGVKFHNGDEMTVDDVAYSFQRGLLQGGSASPQWMLAEPILGVDDIAELIDPNLVDNQADLAKADVAKLKETCQKVVDAIVADASAGTVTFKLQQSWAPFLATLAQTWGSVTDKKWVVENGGWDGDCATWQNFYGKNSEEINKTKLGTGENGTGPYILDHWKSGEEYVLKANETYWRTEAAWEGGPKGAPALKTIIVKNVEEFSTRLAMLQAGDIDSTLAGSSADWPQMDTLVGEICEEGSACVASDTPNKGTRVYKKLASVSRTDAFMSWAINTEGGNNFIGSGKLDGNGIPDDFFANVHIRKAFAYCFDMDTYIRDVQLGEGVQSFNVMLPGMIGYDDNSPHYSFDADKCKAEFDAAAPELKEKYGADLNEVGFRFTIAYNTGNTQRQTVAQILQQGVNAINEKFVIEVTGLPWPNFLQNQRAKKLPIFVSGWLEDIHDPHNWVVPYTIGTYGGRQGLPDELKKQFGEIIARAVAETDPTKRAAIYKEFNQLYYDQIPTILLSVQLNRRYEQRWVQGWFSNPILPGTYFYSMSKK